jgi:hypothetical protein
MLLHWLGDLGAELVPPGHEGRESGGVPQLKSGGTIPGCAGEHSVLSAEENTHQYVRLALGGSGGDSISLRVLV